MSFAYGLMIGFGMVIFIGPVFFTLLENSLKRGFWSGFSTAMGIFISDIVCVALCYFGLAKYLSSDESQFYLGVFGALVLFGFGLVKLIKKEPKIELKSDYETTNISLISDFTKGFAINFLNPFVFLVWIAVIALGMEKYADEMNLYLFLAGSLTAIIIQDVIKAFLAVKIKQFLKPNFMYWFTRATGFVLILFAVRMLWKVL